MLQDVTVETASPGRFLYVTHPLRLAVSIPRRQTMPREENRALLTWFYHQSAQTSLILFLLRFEQKDGKHD